MFFTIQNPPYGARHWKNDMGLINIEGEHSVLLSSPHSVEIISFLLPRFIFWWFSMYNGSVGMMACTFYTYHNYYIGKHLIVGKGQFVYKLTTTPSLFYSTNISLSYLLWRIMPHKQEIGWRHLESCRCTIRSFFAVMTLGEDNGS